MSSELEERLVFKRSKHAQTGYIASFLLFSAKTGLSSHRKHFKVPIFMKSLLCIDGLTERKDPC